MDKQEVYKRAHARLTSLKGNLSHAMIHEKYVREYHQILDSLNSIEVNTDEFRIPDPELVKSWSSMNSFTGEVEYNDYREVEQEYFLYKLDAMLAYLSFE